MALGDPYVTTDDALKYAQVNDSIDDALMEQITRGVSRGIEAYCRRQFNDAGSATAREFDVFDRWRLDVDDFSTLTGLVVKTDTGNNGGFATTIDATTNLTAYPLNGTKNGVPGFPFEYLMMSNTQPSWPVWISNPNGPLVQVTAQWGWAKVPPEVMQACLIKCARILGRRYATGGAVGAGDFVFAVTGDDRDVVDLLRPLRRGVGIA